MAVSAFWHGQEIARGEDTVIVEGNHYFDPRDVKQEFLVASDSSSHCPWKGDASYFSIKVGEEINPDAAWYYSDPKEAAIEIKGRIAFWRDVEIKED